MYLTGSVLIYFDPIGFDRFWLARLMQSVLVGAGSGAAAIHAFG